jgi:hypothetical protein
MVRMGLVQPVEDWTESRDQKYAEHLKSLGALYFAKGQQHLEGLMRWAEGRVKRERPGTEQSYGRQYSDRRQKD